MLNASQLSRVYQKIPKVLREGLFDRAFHLTGYKKQIYDRKNINDFYLKRYPASEILTSKNCIKRVNAACYGKRGVHDLIPTLDLNHAESWVPFLKGRTHVFINNFFEKNYGIRGPILFRFVILRDGKVFSVKNKILQGAAILFTDEVTDEGATSDIPEHGTLMVQAFHPRIKTPTNALRFYGMYRTASGEITCGVHSLTTPLRGLARDMRVGFRSYGAPQKTYGYAFQPSNVLLYSKRTTGSESRLKKLTSGHPLYGGNFFFQRNSEGGPVSVWHDGPVSHRVKEIEVPLNLGRVKTAFLVPNFEDHAPYLRISTERVGFRAESISITAFTSDGSELASKNIFIGVDDTEVDLASVFSGNQFKGHVGFVVDFKRDAGEFEKVPMAHIDIYYRSRSGLSDQVHTDHTFGTAFGHPKMRRSFRCRKFAPFIKSDLHTFVYSIVKTGSEGFIDDDFIYVRIITDTGFEKRFKQPLPENGIMSLSSEWLLEQVGHDIKQVAVVQYEHETINIVGSWYMINHKSGQLAVDHFTGG